MLQVTSLIVIASLDNKLARLLAACNSVSYLLFSLIGIPGRGKMGQLVGHEDKGRCDWNSNELDFQFMGIPMLKIPRESQGEASDIQDEPNDDQLARPLESSAPRRPVCEGPSKTMSGVTITPRGINRHYSR